MFLKFFDKWWFLRDCGIAWLIEVGKREGLLLLAKAKSSKSFYALCARFWDFVESRADLHFVCEILWNHRIYGADSVVLQNLGWILRFFACEILWFCRIYRRFCDFAGFSLDSVESQNRIKFLSILSIQSAVKKL